MRDEQVNITKDGDGTGSATRPGHSFGWESSLLDLEAYLHRVGYDGPRAPSLETLSGLMRAHLDSIPFENLDVILGDEIRLDITSLQRKLVDRRRGGYCHEHNMLFASVLERLGFSVSGRSARMLMGEDESELTSVGHTMLNVSVEGVDWLVDVGVGNVGPRAPIRLEAGAEAVHDAWHYRLDQSVAGHLVLRYRRHEGWFNIYQVSDHPHYRADYAFHNYIASTHPESPFTRRVVVQHNGAEVRYALTDSELKTFLPDAAPYVQAVRAEDVPTLLRDVFRLRLDESQARRLVRHARSAGSCASAGAPVGA